MLDGTGEFLQCFMVWVSAESIGCTAGRKSLCDIGPVQKKVRALVA